MRLIFQQRFQVFYLAPAWNDEARASAQLENASFLAEMNSGGDNDEDDLVDRGDNTQTTENDTPAEDDVTNF